MGYGYGLWSRRTSVASERPERRGALDYRRQDERTGQQAHAAGVPQGGGGRRSVDNVDGHPGVRATQARLGEDARDSRLSRLSRAADLRADLPLAPGP